MGQQAIVAVDLEGNIADFSVVDAVDLLQFERIFEEEKEKFDLRKEKTGDPEEDLLPPIPRPLHDQIDGDDSPPRPRQQKLEQAKGQQLPGLIINDHNVERPGTKDILKRLKKTGYGNSANVCFSAAKPATVEPSDVGQNADGPGTIAPTVAIHWVLSIAAAGIALSGVFVISLLLNHLPKHLDAGPSTYW